MKQQIYMNKTIVQLMFIILSNPLTYKQKFCIIHTNTHLHLHPNQQNKNV